MLTSNVYLITDNVAQTTLPAKGPFSENYPGNLGTYFRRAASLAVYHSGWVPILGRGTCSDLLSASFKSSLCILRAREDFLFPLLNKRIGETSFSFQ